MSTTSALEPAGVRSTSSSRSGSASARRISESPIPVWTWSGHPASAQRSSRRTKRRSRSTLPLRRTGSRAARSAASPRSAPASVAPGSTASPVRYARTVLNPTTPASSARPMNASTSSTISAAPRSSASRRSSTGSSRASSHTGTPARLRVRPGAARRVAVPAGVHDHAGRAGVGEQTADVALPVLLRDPVAFAHDVPGGAAEVRGQAHAQHLGDQACRLDAGAPGVSILPLADVEREPGQVQRLERQREGVDVVIDHPSSLASSPPSSPRMEPMRATAAGLRERSVSTATMPMTSQMPVMYGVRLSGNGGCGYTEP